MFFLQQNQDNYETVGDLNLNILSWYILSLAISSHLSVLINTCRTLWINKFPTFAILIGTLFPYHFVNLQALVFEKRSSNLKNQLKDELQSLANANDFDAEEAKKIYEKLTRSIKITEQKYLQMVELKSSNGKWETLLEHLPSAVVFVSLWILSNSHVALRRFLNETLASQLTANYKWIVILVTLNITISCLSAVINTRNAKRLPLKPSKTEMVYQYLVVTILFFPKLVLAAIALVYVPFLYPIGMVLEWLMVLLYNKAMYGNFNGKVLDYCFFKTIYNHSHFSVCDDGNLITILTPALFQPLQSFRKCRFFNHLIFYFYFHTN